MAITQSHFGMIENTEVSLFTLTNANSVSVSITNYGGIVTSFMVPDKNGQLDDVVLGFDNLDSYLGEHPFFGALIGRHANRIQNAAFQLNGTTYHLAKNDGNNHLHGGPNGFDKKVWDADIIERNALKLSYTSVDGEENYPGTLNVTVIYSLTHDNELRIDYTAISDKDTVVNLTNHSYFNLSGHASGNVLDHVLMIDADKFTVNNDESFPTGEIQSVTDTPLDFTSPRRIGEAIDSDYDQIVFGNGYDQNLILNKNNDDYTKIAVVTDPKSKRMMEVYTTKPGVQFYSANFIDGIIGKDGAVYNKNQGLCLETQYFPNAIKHTHFPSPILKAGDTYHHVTGYKFITK